MKSRAEIISDFNGIARALRSAHEPDRLSPSEQEFLAEAPATARSGLDAGCGHGVMTRALARRGVSMLGIDLSPEMISAARAMTDERIPARYEVADLMTFEAKAPGFDVVVSVNVLHHLPLATIIPRLAGLVAPGGRLLVQDVLSRRGLRHLPLNVAAGASRRWRRWMHGDGTTRAIRAMYDRHGAGETYLDWDTVRDVYASLLPGSRVIRHLEWRYSLVWTRM